MIFQNCKDHLIPLDVATSEKLLLMGKEITLKEINMRDAKFHKCYFSWCGWLWEQMPLRFKQRYAKENMYKVLKLCAGQYNRNFTFKDIYVVEFESISFKRMKESDFRTYVIEQITAFYTEILVPLKMEHLQEEMEEQFKNFFNQLI